MKILITGVTGLIGKYLAKHLNSLGHSILGVGRNMTDNSDLFKYYQSEFMEDLEIEQEVDVIIHVAGQSPYNVTCINDYISGNIHTAKAVANLAIKKNVKTIVYLSSVSVYGDINVSTINEQTPVVNPKIYGMTKYIGEKIFEEIASKIPSIVLRLPGVIGKDSHSSWLSKVVKKAQQGLEIVINNPSSLFNNVVSLKDLSDFIAELIKKPLSGFDVINLGAINMMKIEEIVLRCVKHCKNLSSIKVEVVKHKPFTISIEKAHTMYGFKGSRIQDIIDMYLKEVCV